jgi:hypothetical protein
LNKLTKKDFQNDFQKIIEESITLQDGRIIKAGSIIYRPLKILGNSNVSSEGLNHYGIVLGTTSTGEKLIVDNNQERNVQIDTFEAFKMDFPLSVIHVESNHIDFNLIKKRILELQYELYSLDSFNCCHFVTDCVYGYRKSKAVLLGAKFLDILIKMHRGYIDYVFSDSLRKIKLHKEQVIENLNAQTFINQIIKSNS